MATSPENFENHSNYSVGVETTTVKTTQATSKNTNIVDETTGTNVQSSYSSYVTTGIINSLNTENISTTEQIFKETTNTRRLLYTTNEISEKLPNEVMNEYHLIPLVYILSILFGLFSLAFVFYMIKKRKRKVENDEETKDNQTQTENQNTVKYWSLLMENEEKCSKTEKIARKTAVNNDFSFRKTKILKDNIENSDM